MSKIFTIIGVVLVVLVGGVVFFSQDSSPLKATVGIGQMLASDTTGYTRATGPVPIRFPEDHGAHPDFKLEWWYYTGNLMTAEGRRFGYQFTIFRNALAPPDEPEMAMQSSWRTKQLYFAHLTVSDLQEKEFYAFERHSRGAAGLAGAEAAPFRVWVEDWQVSQVGENMPPMRIEAAEGQIAIDFSMEAVKPVVLQGESGYSIKGLGYGNASYYYSFTRLQTQGTLSVGNESFTVEGFSWMDREWSTSLLSENQVGWDWFSIQLDDGRDIMFAIVRNESPEIPSYVFGTLVDAQGMKRSLTSEEVQLEVLDTWESDKGGVYPSRWRMQITDIGLDLYIEPFMNDQELDVAVRYWEGAVQVNGNARGKEVAGSGYVELTGYDQAALMFTD
ncbi:MAG: lipocalin-like domain-containing protein [Pseudomonadota bacterium]